MGAGAEYIGNDTRTPQQIGFPVGIVAVDGKNIRTSHEMLDETYSRRETDVNGNSYWIHMHYRAVLTRNRLKPDQILSLVRRYWVIENECNRTLDVEGWLEDTTLGVPRARRTRSRSPQGASLPPPCFDYCEKPGSSA